MLKESLLKLRTLVDSLEDRDKALKQDHNLFEKFFENFPIPVSMWSVNAEGKVLSCNGNGFLNEIAKTEDDLFVCDQVAGKIKAAKSECKDVKELIVETEESTYFAKIITRKDGDTFGLYPNCPRCGALDMGASRHFRKPQRITQRALL